MPHPAHIVANIHKTLLNRRAFFCFQLIHPPGRADRREHPRSFARGDTVYDPWHYVPVLARKPGALRNGAPFKDWVLPAAMERMRRKLAGADDGNRQMVNILTAVLADGPTT
jgi:hypothetical protein